MSNKCAPALKNLVQALPSPSFGKSFLDNGLFVLVSKGSWINPPGLFTDLPLEVNGLSIFHVGSSLSTGDLSMQCCF